MNITKDTISNKPNTIRELDVMLGCDLAELFTVEEKMKINYFSIMYKINTWNSQL